MRQLNEDGISLIENFEGFVDHVYNDRGHPAIGYGHRLLPGESFPDGITKEQARNLLILDVAQPIKSLETWVKVPINDNQFSAACSLIFNIGSGNFKRSKLLIDLNNGDFAAAADDFLEHQWSCDANGVFLAGKAKRRAKERDLFLKPIEEV